MSLTQIERLILNDSIDDVDVFLSDKEADTEFVLADFIVFKTNLLKAKYEITDEELTLEFLKNINISNDAGKALRKSKEYIGNRANAYPSIADQLDDIYHNGVDEWKKTIKAVKDANPKPE